jgi:hypothetical protein
VAYTVVVRKLPIRCETMAELELLLRTYFPVWYFRECSHTWFRRRRFFHFDAPVIR